MTDKPDQQAPSNVPATSTTSAPSAATTLCPHCDKPNRVGSLVCEHCRRSLMGADKDGINTKKLGTLETGTSSLTADLPSIAVQTPIDAPAGLRAPINMDDLAAAVRSAGSGIFEEHMLLRMEVEGSSQPIVFYPKTQTSIGRRDPVTGTIPDIDLTMYAGYRMGVSRSHCILRLKDAHIEVLDGGSSNGTSLNGTRLPAHTPYILRDGDELMLGKMAMRLIFQKKRPTL